MAGQQWRAFRLDASIPAVVSRPGGILNDRVERACLVRNMSESGCKLAIEGATAEGYPVGLDLVIHMRGPWPLELTGRVVRHAEAIDGWGLALGLVFTNLSRGQRDAMARLFVSDHPHISRASSQDYRRQRRRRSLRHAALSAVAIIVGFAFMLAVREGLDSAGRQTETSRPKAMRRVREDWGNLTPEERRAVIDSMSTSERQRYQRMLEAMPEEEKTASYDGLTDEEKARARKMYEKAAP